MFRYEVRKIVFSVCAFVVAAIVAGCGNMTLNEPVREYFEKYTDAAMVLRRRFDVEPPIDKNGNPCLQSNADGVIYLDLHNPQSYILEFDLIIGGVSKTEYVSQESGELVKITIPKADLIEYEKSGTKNLAPTLKITEPLSGREFPEYSFSLRADTVPPQIMDAVVMLDSANKYVVCFNLPSASKLADIHNDIKNLTIGNESFDLSVSGGDISFVGSPANISKTAPGVLEKNPLTGLDFSTDSTKQAFYFSTGTLFSIPDIQYDITLSDAAGFSSDCEVHTNNADIGVAELYVRAADGDDDNDGSKDHPFKTLQKAIDTVITFNDFMHDMDFKVYVEGVAKASTGVGRVAFIESSKALKVLIKGIGSGQAVLDGNLSSPQADGNVIYAKGSGLDLTLENLKITGGNATGSGGGIYNESGKLALKDCEISGNSAGVGKAIYHNGAALELSGAVQIESSGANANDVYLVNGKYITIADSLAPPDSAKPVAAITLESYNIGSTVVLQASSEVLIKNNLAKFKIVDENYSIKRSSNQGILSGVGTGGGIIIPKVYTFKAFKNGAALLVDDTLSTNDELTFKVYDGAQEVAASNISSFTIEARHGGNDISSVFSGMIQNSTYSDAKIVIPSALVDFADYIDAYICVTIAGSVYDYTVPVKLSHEKVISMAAGNFEDLINSVINAGVRDLVITVNDVSNENFSSLVSYINGIGNVYYTNVDTVQLKLEGTLTTIPERAFFANKKLTSVVLPDSLRTIEKQAFSNCTNLVSLNIGSGVVTIGESAFSTCNIGYVRIPASVTTIDKNAFYYNSNVLGVKEVVFEQPTGWSDGTNSIDFTDSAAAADILRGSLNKTYTRN